MSVGDWLHVALFVGQQAVLWLFVGQQEVLWKQLLLVLVLPPQETENPKVSQNLLEEMGLV